MRRRPVLITVCLILGAILNVGLATWAAAYGPTLNHENGPHQSRWSSPWHEITEIWMIGSLLDYQRDLHVRAGFPFTTLEGSATFTGSQPIVTTDGLWVPSRTRNGETVRALPYRPVWPGAILNTLFFAAFLWLLLGGARMTRSSIRRRRNRCPRCGYPIGTSPVCTECGASLR